MENLLMAIDIGNSDIVIGIFEGATCQYTFRTPTSHQKTVADYGMLIRSYLLEEGIKLSAIQKAVLSSVVPALTPTWLQVLSTLLPFPPVVVSPEIYPYLPIKPVNTKEIGADLVANATAAYTKYRKACLVVDFGTALTFTTVAQDGTLIGVAIAPGLKTALKSLVQNTAQLPEVPLVVPQTALGKDTVEALQAGILLGYTGLVKELIHQIHTELGEKCPVIATGGLSFVMQPIQHLFDEIDVQLTLKGLQLIGRTIIREQ